MLKKEFNKKYSCEFCHKRFPTPSKLQRHQLVHSGEKPYLCFICLKGFTQRVHLNTHKKHAHPQTMIMGSPGQMDSITDAEDSIAVPEIDEEPPLAIAHSWAYNQRNFKSTRMGWCPRTGKGQQLMFKEAVREGFKNKIKKSMEFSILFWPPPSGGVKYGIYLWFFLTIQGTNLRCFLTHFTTFGIRERGVKWHSKLLVCSKNGMECNGIKGLIWSQNNKKNPSNFTENCHYTIRK